MAKQWKDIEGFEGLYQVSNKGDVMSLHYYGGKRKHLLKLRKDKDGYLTVGLHGNGKNINAKVHRLVAQAFIQNPEHKPQVNHKDENIINNKVENLEWCDAKYNDNYGNHSSNASLAQQGKRLTTEHIQKIRDHAPGRKAVLMVDRATGEILNEYPSASEASRQINGTATNVSYACRNQGTSYKGYYWRYKGGKS